MNTVFTPTEDNAIVEIALHTSENVRELEFWNKVMFPNRDGYSLFRRYQ
jgi:hypothetical protein